MKHRKFKKGFTLIELVVVIAVIGILAGVSVATYFGVTNSAKESNDISLTKQLNDSLLIGETSSGKKPVSLSEALEVVAKDGFDVSKMTPTRNGYSYVWDKSENKFLLLNEKKEILAPSEFKDDGNVADRFAFIRSAEDASAWEGYSFTLIEDYNKGVYSFDKAISFDTVVPVESLTITSAENKENLLISGSYKNINLATENAEFNMYGNCFFMDAKVSMNSLYVYGTIEQLTLKQGKVVVESGGLISTIDASKKIENQNIQILKENSGEIGTIVINDSDKEKVPQDVETIAPDKINTGFAGGVGTVKSPYLIADNNHFQNIKTIISKKEYAYYKQIEDLSISGSFDFNGSYDGDNHSITVDKCASFNKFTTIFGHACFSGVPGAIHLSNINVQMNGDFAIALLKTLPDWAKKKEPDTQTTNGGLIENITFNSKEPLLKVNQSIFGLLVANTIRPATVGKVDYTFRNITNNVAIENLSTSTGVFIGGGINGDAYEMNKDMTITFENCVNNANFVGADYVGFLYGNGGYVNNREMHCKVNILNCVNNGTFLSIAEKGVVAFAPVSEELNDLYEVKCGGKYVKDNLIKNESFTVYEQTDGYSVKTSATKFTYKLAVNVNNTRFTTDGTSLKDKTIEEIEKMTNLEKNNTTKILLPLNISETEGKKFRQLMAYDFVTAKKLNIVDDNIEFVDNLYHLVFADDGVKLILNFAENNYVNSNTTSSIIAYDEADRIVGGISVK